MDDAHARLAARVGHAFPGGTYAIAHWENRLLTEATGAEPLPDGLAHPAHLFHAPIAGAGVTLAELFALGEAETDASITIDYYDWEIFTPLREAVRYRMQGGVTEFERQVGAGEQIIDSMTFRVDVSAESGEAVARVTFRWHFWKTAGA